MADFSRVLAGPYCTMLLADMGATVIKVESPGGDDTRQWTPPERDGVSTYYLAINRNKHSITLDMTDPADLQTAYDIVDQADVFVENFKPGSLAKFGLDSEAVAERWPGIVHASITGFGSAGGADMPGYDLLAQAMSGMMSITGSQDGPPQRAGVAMFDVMTGMHASIGILGALRERDISGQGQHLEVNLLSSALSGLVNQTSGYAAAGNVPTRLGNDHPSVYPYGPFATADRDLIIGCGNDNQFAKLVQHLGMPELADDERFRTNSQRNAHREELRALLEEALSTATADEWFERFRAAKIASAPILTIGEGVEFADEIGLNPIVEAGGPDDSVPTIKHPVDYSRTPARYDKAPPALGADRDAVLAWLKSRQAQGEHANVAY
ncbi:crotonobetainyl-CoA:carnitine CoA-transferase CaiB-like acyl-CoA transferase [Enteractinococcus fodinae]|uniref:Crotonobetainyl-CoA:carnitine CoA-transferase CaiB-like acyl-CoA transferase n=1 Tax=Enteractinococcus fodinae TaxID=684663 RepID=A0ABU2B3Z0_9MICC|nr:crotonobetainyl-CoA:carnitine CoA-transferase CaiB-like acyl-CoA transferase [Enteractinococcus fodinae]